MASRSALSEAVKRLSRNGEGKRWGFSLAATCPKAEPALAAHYPAQQLADAGALALHEDADPEDTARDPDTRYCGRQHYQDADDRLPQRHARRDRLPRDHQHRRREREERHPGRDLAIA